MKHDFFIEIEINLKSNEKEWIFSIFVILSQRLFFNQKILLNIIKLPFDSFYTRVYSGAERSQKTDLGNLESQRKRKIYNDQNHYGLKVVSPQELILAGPV